MILLVIDEGTTSTRVNLVNEQGIIIGGAGKTFIQYYPQPGWVEHDANEIWEATLFCIRESLEKYAVAPSQIAAIGITNQRETTVLWDRETGRPVGPAIVWQCRRTAEFCNNLKTDTDLLQSIGDKTGLIVDPYFSATKVRWYLEHDTSIRRQAEQGRILFGTIDSWLIWNLTAGQNHCTDHTNASRTLLFDIRRCDWDHALLHLFDVPRIMLPNALPSDSMFGKTKDVPTLPDGIPISGVAGDQQAALFGQRCFSPGEAKNTYGTGCFLLMNSGPTPPRSRHQLLTTIGISIQGRLDYALEGSVFSGGAVVQWLRDELKLISASTETESLALSITDNDGVYIVPAFTGLGAPYWDPNARGTISGLTRGSGIAHLARAALESIAYQVKDVLDAMEEDAGISLSELRVDGGAAANRFLMQFQADILGATVLRPPSLETTSIGAAMLAGLGVGLWNSIEDLDRLQQKSEAFIPAGSQDAVQRWLNGWKRAVAITLQQYRVSS